MFVADARSDSDAVSVGAPDTGANACSDDAGPDGTANANSDALWNRLDVHF